MKVLAAVFNEIDFDGRVQRASEALRDLGEVVVFSLDSGRDYRSEAFRSVVIGRPTAFRSQLFTHLKAWMGLWRLALAEKPDVVHAHDCFMAFPGWVAARISGAALAYDAHELVIPEPTVTMTLRDRIWYHLERWTIRHAELVIAANEERAEVMVEHYGLSRSPLVIQNIPPRPPPAATESASDVVQRNRPDEKLIVYQGDVDVRRGVQRFVEAFRHLPAEYRFVIIGGGPSVESLTSLARALGIEERVTFVKRIPRDALAGVLRRCDVGVVCYSFESLAFLLCASNKVYEYAQVGLPMVMTAQPPLQRVVEQYEIGALVGRDDTAEQIAEAIRRVAEDRDSYVRRAEEFARANVWETEAQKLRGGIRSLGASRT